MTETRFSQNSNAIQAQPQIKLSQNQLLDFLKTITRKIIKESKKKKLNWTLQQNILYLRFLKIHIKQLNSTSKSIGKKPYKFLKMSQFVVSKSPAQCRSHHQKMTMKYQTIANIIHQLNIQITKSFSKSQKYQQIQTYHKYTQVDKKGEKVQKTSNDNYQVKIQSEY